VGIPELAGPKELGGLGLTRLEEYLIFEEIATGDAGLGAVLFLAPFPYQYSYNFQVQRLIDDVSRPYFSGEQPTWHGRWAITEMEHAADLLESIRSRMGVTIIWVEHIMGVLMRIVDRVIVLDHGEKIFEGAPALAAVDPRVTEVYLGKERSKGRA